MMSDNPIDSDVQSGTDPAPTSPPPAEAQTTDSGKDEHMIPKSRFDEVNAQYKAVQKQLDDLSKAQTDREEAEALARGDHEKVIADLKPKAEQADKYAEQIEAMLETELEDVPEDKRDLVPDGDPLTRLKWLQRAKAKGVFAAPKPPSTDAGAQGDGSQKKAVELTATERDYARAFGWTDEQYAANKENKAIGQIPPEHLTQKE
jgi:ribonucleoside-triphosphate reductase